MARFEDFRMICPCQQHSRRFAFLPGPLRSFALRFAPWIRGVGTLLFGLPLAFGIAEVPARVIERTDALHEIRARSLVQRREPRVEQSFSLITEQVKSDFLPLADSDEKKAELLTERFFKEQIPYGAIIYREARRNGLPPELVAAIVATESDFRPTLVSSRDARGLMQIVPSTGTFLGAGDLMNPAENVRAGTKYLRYLHRRYKGDQRMILAAYNAGEGNVARFGGIPPFPETVQYLDRVTRSRRVLRQRLQSHLAEFRECYAPFPVY